MKTRSLVGLNDITKPLPNSLYPLKAVYGKENLLISVSQSIFFSEKGVSIEMNVQTIMVNRKAAIQLRIDSFSSGFSPSVYGFMIPLLIIQTSSVMVVDPRESFSGKIIFVDSRKKSFRLRCRSAQS